MVLLGDVLYVIGGGSRETLTAHNVVRRFDLNEETWLPDITGILPDPILASYATACPVVNGKVVIGGGATTANGDFSFPDPNAHLVVSDAVTVFDIEMNAFGENTVLPEPLDSHLVLLAGDRLIALGGNPGPSVIDSDERTRSLYIGVFGE